MVKGSSKVSTNSGLLIVYYYIMSSSKLKAPPLFDPDKDSYEAFKKELEIWNIFTDLDKKKRGPAVYLTLEKKVKQAVSQLTPAEISTEDGLQLIIQKLDDVYLADKSTRAYTAFQKFYLCKRDGGESFEDFIVRFEDKYNDMAQYEMELPDGIKAFFVLNASNLPEETEQLARATAELTYRSMKDQIKRICGSSFSTKEDKVAPPVKDEVFYGYEKRKGDSQGRGRGRGRGRGQFNWRGQSKKKTEDAKESNSTDW